MIKILKFTLEYSDFLFECRNNSEIYKYFFNPTTVTREDHDKWISSIFQNSKRLVYIIFDSENPCGMINASVKNNEAEIGIYIIPQVNSKGVASMALQQFEKMLKEEHKIIKLIAKIIDRNEASKKFFTRNNYDVAFIQFEKKL